MPVDPLACLPFVTADLALRADGTWRVIELGDGQVTTERAAFLNAFSAVMRANQS